MAFAFSRVRWPWALGLSATLTTLLWCLLSLNPLGHTIYRPLPLISVPPGKTWRLSLVPYEPRRSAEGMPSVAILTPTKNARRHIDRLLALFKNLSYPRDRVSLAFLDSDSNDLPTPAEKADVVALAASGALPDFDLLGESSLVGHDSLGHGWRATGSLYSLLRSVPDIQKAGFASLRIIQRDFGLPLPQGDRHAPEFQRARREVLARSRNTLLAAGLEKEDWALWIDSDVASLPTGERPHNHRDRAPHLTLVSSYFTMSIICASFCICRPHPAAAVSRQRHRSAQRSDETGRPIIRPKLLARWEATSRKGRQSRESTGWLRQSHCQKAAPTPRGCGSRLGRRPRYPCRLNSRRRGSRSTAWRRCHPGFCAGIP